MEKTVIYKNKSEIFQCHFEVDGVPIKDISVRLCLEFDNNKNIFFNGTISEDGDCSIKIPKLSELENKSGKLTVEAIADYTYFKLYECDVIVKNSVDIKMTSAKSFQKEQVNKEANISLSEIKITQSEEPKPTKEDVRPVEESTTPHFDNPYISPKAKSKPAKEPVKEPVKEGMRPVEESALYSDNPYINPKAKKTTASGFYDGGPKSPPVEPTDIHEANGSFTRFKEYLASRKKL